MTTSLFVGSRGGRGEGGLEMDILTVKIGRRRKGTNVFIFVIFLDKCSRYEQDKTFVSFPEGRMLTKP